MAQDKGDVQIRKMDDADLGRVNAIDRSLFGEERAPTWPFSFDAYWRVYHPELSFTAVLEGQVGVRSSPNSELSSAFTFDRSPSTMFRILTSPLS